MKMRRYLSTYFLVKGLNQYREAQRKEVVRDENEFCENYYRVEDKQKDGRGSF